MHKSSIYEHNFDYLCLAYAREPKPKRKRGGGIDHAASDDSDFDDLHKIAGATAALRIGGGSQAGSAAAQSGRAVGAKSFTARSAAGKTSAGSEICYLGISEAHWRELIL